MKTSEAERPRYELHEELGRGGTGIVYRAYDTHFERMVALKVIVAPVSEERCFAHWRKLSTLSHPNLIPVYDIGRIERDGAYRPYVVMPLVEGETLQALSDRMEGRWETRRAQYLWRQAAAGVAALHAEGLHHGALRPSNLYVMTGDSLALLDSGIYGESSSLANEDLRALAQLALRLMPNLHLRPFTTIEELAEIVETGAAVSPGLKELSQALSRPSDAIWTAEAEPDLARRVEILEAAWAKFPGEERIAAALERAREKRTMAEQLVAKARLQEEEGFLNEALAEWRTLEQLHPEYPRLGEERRRLEAQLREAADPRLEQLVTWATEQARTLQALDDLPGAKAVVDEVLGAYPREPRLLALRSALLRAQDRRPVAVAGNTTLTPVAALAKNKRIQLAIVAAAVFILLLSMIAVLKRPPAAPPPPAYPVAFRTEPRGATIRIAGIERGVTDLTLELQAGEYRAEAELEGYELAETRFTVKQGAPVVVEMALKPWKPALRVVTDFPSGQASWGEQAMNAAAPGEYRLDGLENGTKALSFRSAPAEFNAMLKLDARELPVWMGAPVAREARVLLLTAMGGTGRLWMWPPGGRAAVDEQPPLSIGPDGAPLMNLKRGSHLLTVEEGETPRQLRFELPGGPAVVALVFRKPDPEAGVLLVQVNEDNATVSLNGARSPFRSRGGWARVSGVAPGTYEVRVTKDGFEAEPAEAKVAIVKGQEARLKFQLKARVRLASMQISGAAPGATVLVDGQEAGATNEAGGATISVAPGEHTIELVRGAGRSRPLTRRFAEGEAVALGRELALIQPNGTLRLEVAPNNALVMLRQAGESEAQAKPVGPGSISLAEGTYVLTASAQGYTPAQQNVTITSGMVTTLAVQLKLLENLTRKAAPPPSPVISGMGAFDDPNAWAAAEDGWMVRRGGGYVALGRTPLAGTVTFSLTVPKGKTIMLRDKSFQFFAGYTDARNLLLYRLRSKDFQRSDRNGGREANAPRKPHTFGQDGPFDVRLEIEPHKVQVYVGAGGQWSLMDEITDEQRDFTRGKFGFLIPGGEEYAVKGFRYRPRQ